jgi:hypothetical protein
LPRHATVVSVQQGSGKAKDPAGRAGAARAGAHRELSPEEGERLIVGLLRQNGPMTTQQISAATQAKGVRCPDSTVRFLTKLRARKVILGTVDRRAGTWVWWLEGQQPPGSGQP